MTRLQEDVQKIQSMTSEVVNKLDNRLKSLEGR